MDIGPLSAQTTRQFAVLSDMVENSPLKNQNKPNRFIMSKYRPNLFFAERIWLEMLIRVVTFGGN